MIVYAIDPGKATGLCKFDQFSRSWNTYVFSAMESMEWLHRDISITKDLLLTGAYYRDKPVKIIIVAERWTHTNVRKTQQNDALEVIGASRFLARLWNVVFEQQNRSDRIKVPIPLARKIAKSTSTSAKITDHELDAVRHAVVAVVRHGGVEYVPSYPPA